MAAAAKTSTKTGTAAAAPAAPAGAAAAPAGSSVPHIVQVTAIVPTRTFGTRGPEPKNYPNLNFSAIGRDLSVSHNYIGRVLNGHVRPSMRMAGKISASLGITIDDINRMYREKPVPANGGGGGGGGVRKKKPVKKSKLKKK